MATRKPLVLVSGQVQELPELDTFSVPTAAAADASSQVANMAAVQTAVRGVLAKSTIGGSVILNAAECSNPVIVVTGALIDNCFLLLPQDVAARRLYVIRNQTTGNFVLTIQQASMAPTVVVPQGRSIIVFVTGAGVYEAVTALNSPTMYGTTLAPTIATSSNGFEVANAAFVKEVAALKQDALVSGENIKTINGETLLGSGNIAVSGSVDAIKRPSNISPAQSATGVIETPTLTGSAFYSLYGIPMAAAQFQVSSLADFSTTVLNTGDVAGAATAYTLASGLLSTSTAYYWRARYKDAEGVYSAWSAPTSFTTAVSFGDYIATPTDTPAAFGDPLEGGFYTGMIWNELVQSASSMTIGTGIKTFTVPNMSGAPIAYAGQQLEVRSRTNPANKMAGTVTSASGAALTLNITSVGGAGTLSDWSIMARYRVIVAPKASGENASIAYKNANTPAPAATGTLTEGRKATLAMVGADTSTVYPAAHWCNNLSIGGRTDWYLPARDELELCWRNLKPVTNANYTTADRPAAATPNYQNLGSFGGAEATHGLNKNSAPAGAAYTSDAPAQTAAAAFRTGGAEAYEFGSAFYWSSSEYNSSYAWPQSWSASTSGYQSFANKSTAIRVRAVRRSII